jgi:signal peptidase I
VACDNDDEDGEIMSTTDESSSEESCGIDGPGTPPEEADTAVVETEPSADASSAAEEPGEDASAAPDAAHKARRKHLPIWQEAILLLGIALVLAIVIKALFVQPFYIPSESMEPGLIKNDRILVEKPSYWFGEPQRGDVIVFKDPGGWLNGDTAGPDSFVTKTLSKIGLYPSGGHLVKRVIGVPGDVITCCDDQDRIMVNGEPLDEKGYARAEGTDCYGPQPTDPAYCDWEAGPVPDGRLFVMGDNRSHSADSSYHLCPPDEAECGDDPYIDEDLVVGKVVVLMWPRNRLTILRRPDAFADVPDPS